MRKNFEPLRPMKDSSRGRECGYENDAPAALAAAGVFLPQSILLDAMMPWKTGGELAASFHANLNLNDVPIVFLTEAATKGEVEAVGGQFGCFPFLAKPVVMAVMLACLRPPPGE